MSSHPLPQNPTLRVNEIFYSLQGESTRAGEPCAFIRLTGCHLRCGYCDTEYAFHEGDRRTLDDIIAQVTQLAGPCRLVEVTGGEPLLQAPVHELMTRLCDQGWTVLLETSGACDISPCDRRVIRIMDFKTPGSGEEARNHWPNVEHLRPHDEVKFVLCAQGDYAWARDIITRHRLHERVHAVLLSAVHAVAPGKEIAGVEGLPIRDLAQWVLDDTVKGALPSNVRLQTQLHKLIWDPTARGV